MIFSTALIFLTLGVGMDAFKILVFFPMPSYSHQRAILSLTERLVMNGHELFVVSPNAVPGLEQHPNYTFVDVSFTYEYFGDPKKDEGVNLQSRISKWELIPLWTPTTNVVRKEFESEAFLQFLRRVQKEEIKFDVAIMENWLMPLTCGLTRVISGSIPIITMTTVAADVLSEDDLGSLTHLSFVPSIFSDYTDRMNLWQRLENWVSHTYLIHNFKRVIDLGARSFFKDNFGSENENLIDGCWSNSSLLMITSNPVYFYPRLKGPNVVEVGPLHLKPPKKLSSILQDWLDGAEKGVIYFSLGSNMKSKSLPTDVRANFLKIFKELPAGYRVLWKWELDGQIPGQSNNILAQKWVPQESVLAHPKVRVFITQGGLQSFQEAVHYGVPTICIPWFGDQDSIASKMVDAGIGLHLPLTDLHSYEKVKISIEKVLYDERFYKNMQKLSAISHDFTSRGMDEAVFWVEHVTRHGGASHLRPATADATLFQFFCLDIIAVILVLIFISLFVTYKVCTFSVSLIKWGELASKIKKS